MLKLLPLEERGQYQTLVSGIAADVEGTRKHSGVAEFVKHVSLVHRFITRGNRNDPLRGVVCGVEFGRGFVLVSTDRLKKVLYRSKSCMNGCWQRPGYDVMRPSHDIVTFFTRLLPNVNPEFFAIRQWCVRLVRDGNRLCFVSNLPDSLGDVFDVQRLYLRCRRRNGEFKSSTVQNNFRSVLRDEFPVSGDNAIGLTFCGVYNNIQPVIRNLSMGSPWNGLPGMVFPGFSVSGIFDKENRNIDIGPRRQMGVDASRAGRICLYHVDARPKLMPS
jgi:hypothetical protein